MNEDEWRRMVADLLEEGLAAAMRVHDLEVAALDSGRLDEEAVAAHREHAEAAFEEAGALIAYGEAHGFRR